MKDHIHTIPVLDALREPGHCPFCIMYATLDDNAIDFVMGPAYMDEDIRDSTNEAGFCEKHLIKLYGVQNRLGAALLLHTHIQQIQKNIKTNVPLTSSGFSTDGKISPADDKASNSGAASANSGVASATGGIVGAIFRKRGNSSSQAGKISSKISSQQNRCFICEKIDNTFKRYIDTFFHMWPKEAEMKPLVEALPGFCLPHYAQMLAAAESSLNPKHLDGFLSVVIPLQQRAMEKLDHDLDWFIQKFDYRNADAPWKDSKDALVRALAMLKGCVVE